MSNIINGVASEYDIPISKENIKFSKVDGSKVFDLVMEIDKLQQENNTLQQQLKDKDEKINKIIEYIKQNCGEIDDYGYYPFTGVILNILESNKED